MREDYVLVPEAADKLGMTKYALWKAIARKQIATERLGPLHLIHRDELERFRIEKRNPGWQPGTPRRRPLES